MRNAALYTQLLRGVVGNTGDRWWDQRSSMDFDFVRGRYYLDGPTSIFPGNVTRAGSVLMLGPEGYQSFAAGELARIDGVGAQVAPARTELVLNTKPASPLNSPAGASKASFAGTFLGMFDGAAAVTSQGADWHRLQFQQLTLTAGTAYVVDAFYQVGSSGRARLVMRGTVSNTESRITGLVGSLASAEQYAGAISDIKNQSLGGGLYRTSFVFTPQVTQLFSPAIGPDSSAAGQDVVALHFSIQEGSYTSPPIITSGAAVSRPGDILSASVPDGGRAFVFEFDLLEPSAGESQRRIVSFGSSAGNEIRVLLGAAGAAVISSAVAGVSGGQTNTVSMPSGIKRGYAVFSSGRTALGFVGGSETVASTPVALPLISASSFLGNPFNTSNNSFGIMRKFAERPVTDFATPDDAFAWAKSIAQGWA